MNIINKTSSLAIELLGNRLLALDAEASNGLSRFSGKVIHININDLALDYYLLFPGGSLVVQSSCDREPSAAISGKLSAFIAAATTSESGDAVFSGELNFSGEINTARQFQNFVQRLQIDWQEPLSRTFGDTLGHSLTTGIIQLHQFGKSWLTNLQHDVPEYLQEELLVTPTQTEVNIFCDQVDLLRSQTDRLKARIERLIHND